MRWVNIWVRTALVALLLGSLNAAAELRIEITKGQGQAVPMAVVPFGWEGEGATPYDLSAVVSADLARSGRFAPLPVSDMLQKPTRGADIDFSDWRIVDTQYLVVGRLLADGTGGYDIEFRLFDVFRADLMMGYRMNVDADGLRKAAHQISDLVYEKITGVRGIASTSIAYVSVVGDRRKPTYRLIVADADGANARLMMESAMPIMSPAWSPDGRRLAYVSFENDNSHVYVQELRSGARRRVSARKGVNSAPVWSPDGKQLALTLSRADGNLDVYTLILANQVLKRITTWPSIETEPGWSIDGKELFFTSDRSGAPQVYRVSAEGGRPTRLTYEGKYNARPRISPDGKRLAVVHNDRGNYRIALVDVDRAYTQVLSEGHQDESPSFAPNGEVIIYASRMGRQGVLSSVSTDGRVHQRIAASEGDVREPAWSPFLGN